MSEKPKADDEPERPAPDDDAMTSTEALKKGVGLLWQAAKTAADEIQSEVDVDAVKGTLQKASRELEEAAKDAAKTLEDLIERGVPPATQPSDTWPPKEPGADDAAKGPGSKEADDDAKAGGEDDANAGNQAFRIQVDDD